MRFQAVELSPNFFSRLGKGGMMVACVARWNRVKPWNFRVKTYGLKSKKRTGIWDGFGTGLWPHILCYLLRFFWWDDFEKRNVMFCTFGATIHQHHTLWIYDIWWTDFIYCKLCHCYFPTPWKFYHQQWFYLARIRCFSAEFSHVFPFTWKSLVVHWRNKSLGWM